MSMDWLQTNKTKEYFNESTVPFLWHGLQPVGEDLEVAEVMALAFKESAKEYFPKLVKFERDRDNAINLSQEGYNSFRNFAIFGVIILGFGAFSFIVNWALGLILLIVGGLLLAFSYLYFYMTVYKGALGNIAIYESKLEGLVPEEQVEFVSKVYVPFYIIPYSATTSILFDAVGKGTTENISVVNMKSDEVISGLNGLSMDTNKFDSVFNNGELLTFDGVISNFPNTTPDDQLERNIMSRLDTINTAVVPENWIQENLELTIHVPNSQICDVITKMIAYEKKPSHFPSVPTKLTLSDAETLVSKVRGAESKSLDGELTSSVVSWFQSLSAMMDPIEQRLSTSIEQGLDQNTSVADFRNTLSHVQVCPICLEELESVEKVPVAIRYDLGEFIMDKFNASIMAMHGGEVCSSCGGNISAVAQFEECPSCHKRKTVLQYQPGSAQAKAGAMVKSRIKADLKEIPMISILGPKTLNISGKTWTCPIHSTIKEPHTLNAFDEVFAHTADKVWTEMEAPIRKRAEEANVFVTQNRQKLNDQLLALLPFEQDITLLNIERTKLEIIGKISDSIILAGDRQ